MRSDEDIQNLIAKFLAGEASSEEAIQLEDWKAETVANKEYFDSVVKIFTLPKTDEIKAKTQAWANILAKINEPKNQDKIRKLKWWKLAVAASVVLVISLAVVYKYSMYNLPGTKVPEDSESIVFSTELSAQKLKLIDSSDIVLEAKSSIVLDKDFGKNNRNISLTGSAFFSVKHNSSLPFVVNMNHLHIKDIGTKFHIVSKVDTVMVTMEEGEVLLFDDFGAKQRLVGKQKAMYATSVRRFEFYSDTLPKDSLPKNPLNNKKNKSKKPKSSEKKADSSNIDETKSPIKTDN